MRVGETLTGIASSYGVSVAAIITANHLADPNTLTIGTRLVIPVAGVGDPGQGPAPVIPGTYTVQPGDTLIGIANKTGVSVEQLTAANKISDPALIRVGEVLKIPGEAADNSVPPAPAMSDGQYTLSSARGGPPIALEISGGHLVSLTIQTASSGKQSFPLSCEAKIASQLAMMYGLNFDEIAFMDRLPHSLNPQRGFVGSSSGRFYWPADVVGGTADGPGGYGVHVEGWLPTFQSLSGFQARLLSSSPAGARSQIDAALRRGYPVAIWAMLNFRPPLQDHSVWVGASASGVAIDCGGPGAGCHYLASGEHSFLVLGRARDQYLIYNPGNGDLGYFSIDTVITGITTFFAVPTGSAPGAVIVPSAGYTPDLAAVPGW
ncbi:MAG TPA: LysM peptidoglycan-binding domain-containing protein [Aggregatilineales bacterium]|nr:LysM peptidoglycan-binding domain-containing protein [Aggregatilineales bacterium]